MAATGCVTAAGMSCDDIVESVMRSKRNSNCIIDLEKFLLSENENTVQSATEATTKLFCYFLENGVLSPGTQTGNRGEADEKYCCWLKDRYNEIKSLFCDLLQHSSTNIQESSLVSYLKLVKAEGENPMKIVSKDTWYFPKETFQMVMECLASSDKNMQHLIISLREFMAYNDIKLYVLKAISNILENTGKEASSSSSLFLQNIYYLLNCIQFPSEFNSKDISDIEGNTFIDVKHGRPVFKLKCVVFRKVFSSAWIKFLSFKLPSSLYKNVLISLHEVLPHLKNPLLLTDFFTDSYNVGGAVSLLALNGLFFLIQQFNLEYPNFYEKLYALFQPDIITSKYRARFFHLSDLFLTSTHLPGYLVAAFIKRLARLALSAPPHVMLLIIPFIGNLLIRHPSLKILMHSPGKPDVTSDPYDVETSDPTKCNAIESSLWELKTLQNHWHPAVSKKARFLNNVLPQMEWDISSALEVDFDDLLGEESGVSFENAPMSFDKPLGFFERHEDRMNDLWTL